LQQALSVNDIYPQNTKLLFTQPNTCYYKTNYYHQLSNSPRKLMISSIVNWTRGKKQFRSLFHSL